MLKVEYLDIVEGPCTFCGAAPADGSIRISRDESEFYTSICSEECMDLFVRLSDNDKVPVDWRGSYYDAYIEKDNKITLGAIKDD